MLWINLAILEIISFEFILGGKIVPFIPCCCFPPDVAFNFKFFLLSFGVRWAHYCIRNDYGASVGEVSLHLFLALNMCQ